MRIKVIDTPEAVNYCKQQLKDGTPIIVENLETGEKHSTNAWRRIVYDKNGDTWIEEIVYDPDKKDRSGARVKFTTRRM